jgi:formylglycine-generating enzyme required for sulfatase activity
MKFAVVSLFALAGLVHAATPPIKPLPVNRATDKYESRASFLEYAAAFETTRLASMPLRDDRENEHFAREAFAVELAPGVSLRFVRVASSHYVDGFTPELRDAIMAVPNRASDLRRWEGMFEVERRDRVTIPYDFFMAETIVSNAMFNAFVRETGYRTNVERFETGWVVDGRAQWLQGFANDWRLQVHPMSEPDHPVVQVSWFDAMNFAAWLSRKTGVIFRLPTKEEWLLAARPEALRDEVCIFPWGNELAGVETRMNFGTRELTDYMWIHEQFADGHAFTSPVKAYPPNSRGLYDMLGNVWVWNWTSSKAYEARGTGDRTARPAALGELGLEANGSMAMQGGCYLARLSHANLLSKMSHPALDGAEDIGFRLVAVRRADSGL